MQARKNHFEPALYPDEIFHRTGVPQGKSCLFQAPLRPSRAIRRGQNTPVPSLWWVNPLDT